MFPTVLWIMGIYAVAVAIVHWVLRRRNGAGSQQHYVLVAGNHQAHIEGYIRAMQQYSRRTGTDIGITIMLSGSTDHTGAIISRISRSDPGVNLMSGMNSRVEADSMIRTRGDVEEWLEQAKRLNAGKRSVIWIELEKEADVARLPR